MTDCTEVQWWGPDSEPEPAAAELAASIAEARIALRARGIALAQWRSHRAGCARCEAVKPPAGPAQCCRAGRRRLEAYLKASGAAWGAEAVVAAHRTQNPGRLF